ncbi:MAG: hypothetical protein HQK60_15960 [Deltaproteobacteria bacterium]|nr:hypothetical protein [Deltaproteobacteria bacterium]
MAKKRTPGGETSEIKGLVIPESWNEAGEVVEVVISGFDEVNYLVEKGPHADELVALIHKEVNVKGILKELNGGVKMIKVDEYQVAERPKSRGIVKAIVVLICTLMLGFAPALPSMAADDLNPAPKTTKATKVKKAKKVAKKVKKAKKAKKAIKKAKKAKAEAM